MARVRAEVRACVPQGMSVLDYRILRSIAHGRTRISDIAAHVGVSQPSMSRSIDALVKRGFIEREAGSLDRRMSALKLTKKGRDFFKEIDDKATERIYGIIKGIETAEVKSISAGLDTLEKILPPKCRLYASERLKDGRHGK
ncbi:MAG: MarR family transcriptional regulator [Spirochaetia bacterium]|nr:MarR family transcriptional regulator [Spirochaetia bacterium]